MARQSIQTNKGAGNTEILTAKHAGFCFGVERAVQTVEQLLSAQTGRQIFTLGTLIHNPHFTTGLARRGVTVIGESELAATAASATEDHPVTVVVRTHGIPAQTDEQLRAYCLANPAISVTDCTCPFVKKIHRIAAAFSEPFRHSPQDALGIIIGDATHPEVIGIQSYFKTECLVFDGSDAFCAYADSHAAYISSKKAVAMVAQTTQNLNSYRICQKKLEKLYTNAQIFDTICSVTEERQLETASLAELADAMVVIGGRNSSNTQKLYEISRARCAETYFVESPDEVPRHLSITHKTVGITAGASTPRGIIEEVYKTMSEEITNEQENEQVKEQSFEEMLDESFKTLNTGDIVTGVITSISATEIHVDIGSKVTGILSFDDITDDPSVDVKNCYKVGDTIEAIAFRVSDVDGVATLSKKRIDSINNWQDILKARDEDAVLTGKIVETMEKGCLIVVCGTKVFIPASHSGLPRGADMKELLGTTQRVKIIDINEQRRRAVASIREVEREERQVKEAAFWSEIEVGKHYQGVVKSFMPYGAFVDLGGVDGMVHTSELSWRRIKHPSNVVSIGDVIDVYVKDFDVEKHRISLGYKTEESNPWTLFTSQYVVGDVASVKILNMMPFGAFAEIIPGVDGLIHISQIADRRIASPAEVLEKGQVVDAKIVGIDNDAQKVSLSIRALLANDEEADAYEEDQPAADSEQAEAPAADAEHADAPAADATDAE